MRLIASRGKCVDGILNGAAETGARDTWKRLRKKKAARIVRAAILLAAQFNVLPWRQNNTPPRPT
jgi:hypothetical protein